MVGLRALGKLALIASVLVRGLVFLMWHRWSMLDAMSIALVAIATWLIWLAFKSAMQDAEGYWRGRYTRLENEWKWRYNYLLAREEELLAKMDAASTAAGLAVDTHDGPMPPDADDDEAGTAPHDVPSARPPLRLAWKQQ